MSERPADLLPEGKTGELIQVNGWLYVVSDEGSLMALDSRDPRYIPAPEEVVYGLWVAYLLRDSLTDTVTGDIVNDDAKLKAHAVDLVASRHGIYDSEDAENRIEIIRTEVGV